MNGQNIKQQLSQWARQTIIYAILVRENFAGNPFESPPQLQRATATANSVINEIWNELRADWTPEQQAMLFVGKVLEWIKYPDDLSVTHIPID